MYLDRLELVDFRSYPEARVQLGSGPKVFVGANAQGKTNLVEAVHYLAVGSSHRVATDTPMVRAGTDAAIIRARAKVEQDTRTLTVEFEVRANGRNRARVNGQPQPRTRDAFGQIRAVLFAPEDLALVRGDPGDRRRFLDELLGQRRPAYVAARSEYERVLKQRNALLKQSRAGGMTDGGTMRDWTEALIRTGATLLAARIAVVHAMAGPADDAYRELVSSAPGGKADQGISLTYEISTGRQVRAAPGEGIPDVLELAEELREGLGRVERQEAERAITLIGPHRDDLSLEIGELPAKGYASHGEGWSLALALRLASREVLREVGEDPIMLLDDVFAELDDHRRECLARRCNEFEQVLITAAVDGDVPLNAPRHHVLLGKVTEGGVT